jgi:hypothetical protein
MILDNKTKGEESEINVSDNINQNLLIIKHNNRIATGQTQQVRNK